jgi:hypothetical protein
MKELLKARVQEGKKFEEFETLKVLENFIENFIGKIFDGSNGCP